MSENKTILVTGATGAQGGSVARFLLQSGEFGVRALTRHPDSDSARALRSAGAEVVAGSLEDPDSLKAALRGVQGVYGLTNFWEHFDKEPIHGRNLVDAVASADVETFVFSTLPSVEKITGGELKAPHLDYKAEIAEYASQRIANPLFVSVAFYYENYTTFFVPQKQEDGTFAFGFPQGDTRLAMVGVSDVGGVVLNLFQRPAEFRGRTVGIVGDDEPVACYAETLSEATGRTVRYNHIPREVFASFGFPGAEDLANMFEFNRTKLLNRRADLDESRRLYPGMRTFYQWAIENSTQLKALLSA